MADRKISDLTALTTPASGDYVPIVDISEGAAASKNKRVTIQSLFQGIPVNVGIGTSSPSYALHVNTSAVADFELAVQNGAGLARYGTRTSGNAFAGSFTAGKAFELWSANAQAVTIDSSGNVGIGTSSPGYKLEVYGDGTSTSTLGLINPSATNGAAIYFGDSNQSSAIKTIPAAGTHSLGFFVAGSTTERLRIDSSGRVGIGLSPATQLDVQAGTTASSSFGLRVAAGTNTSDYCARFNNAAGTFLAGIDGSGRVGIGASSPTTLLDVNADTVRVRTARTPASATATGATGEICWDANYIYVCTATNTWKRSALSTW